MAIEIKTDVELKLVYMKKSDCIHGKLLLNGEPIGCIVYNSRSIESESGYTNFYDNNDQQIASLKITSFQKIG